MGKLELFEPGTLTVLCTLKDCWNNQAVRQIITMVGFRTELLTKPVAAIFVASEERNWCAGLMPCFQIKSCLIIPYLSAMLKDNVYSCMCLYKVRTRFPLKAYSIQE